MYLSISTIIYYWILTAIIQPQTVRQQNTMDVFASSIGIITLITINIPVTILDNVLLIHFLLMTPSGKHSTNFTYCKHMCPLVHYSLLVLR
jgi:hypothetical protein